MLSYKSLTTGESEAPPSTVGEEEGTDEVDLRGFRPAGRPFIIELIEMPPPAKTINNWTIRKGMESRKLSKECRQEWLHSNDHYYVHDVVDL